MFGIGTQEILLILALAIIVVGPRKLPEMASSFGRAFSQFRKAMDDLKESAATDLTTTVKEEKRKADEDFLKKYPDLAEEARRREAEATAQTDAPATSSDADSEPPPMPPDEELPTYPPESVEH